MKLRKGERTFLPKTLRSRNSVGDNAGSLMVRILKCLNNISNLNINVTNYFFIIQCQTRLNQPTLINPKTSFQNGQNKHIQYN